jgi:hypothetical protein
MDVSTPLGTVLISGNTATYSTSTLGAGTHSITAVYFGDANFATSTSAILSQTVNKSTTSTSVISSSLTSAFNSLVTFTATVTGVGATGTVTFMDSSTPLGTVLLSGNTAAYSTSTLGAGTHSITAVYFGDANFATSTSAILSQNVNKSTTSTSVSSAYNPSAPGGSVTFTAIVAGAGATGTVAFNDGGTFLGNGLLSGGTATVSTTGLTTVGSHSITATYSGDGNFTSSISSPLTQTVNIADGNIKGTGSVDITDALQALRFAAGLDIPTPLQISRGDVAPLVNGQRHPDGKIDINDVVAILRKVAGLPSW